MSWSGPHMHFKVLVCIEEQENVPRLQNETSLLPPQAMEATNSSRDK